MMQKNNIIKFLAVLLLVCILAGCEINEAIGKQTEMMQEKPTEEEGSENSPAPEKENTFSVTLMYNGAVFNEFPVDPIKAIWTSEKSVHEAEFDVNTGVASIQGLDGDYTVTLSSVPDGYTYNPNVNRSGNNNKNIIIELYKPIIKSGSGGSSLYKCITITELAVYRASLPSATSEVYFSFAPKQSGTYTVESWVDITANNVNPKVDVYNGTAAAKFFSRTVDEGGVSSTYTKNFVYEIKIDERMLGSTFTFAIRADSLGSFPVDVDFALRLDGGFALDWSDAKLMIPNEELIRVNAPAGAKLKNPEVPAAVAGKYVFDGKMFGLNEEDGFYHKYNEETGEYDGELLFAYITMPCRFLELSFTHIEDPGNTSLTVSNGTENYKFFIEGVSPFQNYFCAYVVSPYREVCPCIEKKNNPCPGVCVIGCDNCHKNCTNVTQEEYDAMMYYGGYADYANSDGMCPVTPELKDFLQKFSIAQRLFNDGNGWVEENPTIDVDALEDDQWLFACAYYEGFTNLD